MKAALAASPTSGTTTARTGASASTPSNKADAHRAAAAATTTRSSSSPLANMAYGVRDVALFVVLAMYLTVYLVQDSYHTYLVPLAESYRRQLNDADGYYPEYENDFTYYNRHCSDLDISTDEASDLLITDDMSAQEAADKLHRHGALAFSNVLDNATVSELRAYLSSRHAIRHELSWNEVFWDGEGGTRLSLGIGTHDHPAIAAALQQIGRHQALKRTLQAALGEDPAILEVSTLTSLAGAHAQGLHTDTDWFGSSLQYARTFLHSYTFFVALQDTPQALGATTVCPGTHMCADDDLVDLCEEHAFSVSTNGHTGAEEGLLRSGDAFLFHQNLWHRGPAVEEDLGHKDRVMFILTFATRTNNELTPGDYRQQGLGTYYYQRWNMWGATFDYLKDAAVAMAQPWSGLRALGLYHPSGRHIGHYWWDHFCQQMANGDMFYADYELDAFKERIWHQSLHLPTSLRSSAESWEQFLPETLQIWVNVLGQAYIAVAVVMSLSLWYLVVPASSAAATTTKKTKSFMGRWLWIHLGLGALFLAGKWYISQRPFAQKILSGEIFVHPFPAPPEGTTTNRVGPSTLPERADVLIATRFDAPFLAYLNQYVDYHPGNAEWISMVEVAAAQIPAPAYAPTAAHMIVSTLMQRQRPYGYPHTRFLWQDYATGAWRLMSKVDAVEETRRAILAEAYPIVETQWTALKLDLAEARFGVTRDTEVARLLVPAFVNDMLASLFDVKRNTFLLLQQEACPVSGDDEAQVVANLAALLDTSSTTPPAKGDDQGERKAGEFEEGELVWARSEGLGGTWREAVVSDEGDEADLWYVEHLTDEEETEVHAKFMRRYLQVQEGDQVGVDYDGNHVRFYGGTITYVKPDGRCSILFDDGDYLESVHRYNILPLSEFHAD